MRTKPSNMRLDDETNDLIDCLSKHIGSTRTGAVKYAVRETIRHLGLRRNKVNNLRKNFQNTDIPQDYKDNMSERDAFLQTCFDEMFNLSSVCTPETLAEFQSEYDLEACKAFFEDNYNG